MFDNILLLHLKPEKQHKNMVNWLGLLAWAGTLIFMFLLSEPIGMKLDNLLFPLGSMIFNPLSILAFGLLSYLLVSKVSKHKITESRKKIKK